MLKLLSEIEILYFIMALNHPVLSGGFIAKLASSKLLMQVLKAIHFKDDATVLINSNGVKVTVEDAKSFQASSSYYNLR